MVQALRCLENLVAARKDRANTAEFRACKTLNNMSDLQALVEGLDHTVVGERLCVWELVHSELIRVLSVTTATLS